MDFWNGRFRLVSRLNVFVYRDEPIWLEDQIDGNPLKLRVSFADSGRDKLSTSISTRARNGYTDLILIDWPKNLGGSPKQILQFGEVKGAKLYFSVLTDSVGNTVDLSIQFYVEDENSPALNNGGIDVAELVSDIASTAKARAVSDE